MNYCSICVQPDTRPGTQFARGICPACDFQISSDYIEWDLRVRELKSALIRFKKSNPVHYDSILGVSGGKDSTRLALWARDFLGMNPLLVVVSYPPFQLTKRGAANLDNLAELGFDIIQSAPNAQVWKTLMKKTFLENANWAKSTELALFSGVPQIAIEMNIPLILWGENPALQLGALETAGRAGWDGNELRRMNTLSDMGHDWMSSSGVSTNKLFPYQYPPIEDFSNHDIQIVFLGWAMRTWGLLENGIQAALTGLELRSDIATNTSDLIGATSLDEDWVILNQMIKYYKYGFGRATDYVNEWIRQGRITREKGIKIAEKYDGVCHDSYIQSFCSFIEISTDEFWRVVYAHTDKSLFQFKRGSRPVPRFKVGVDS
jgi:N-acetyl sugar amidotransferase